MNKRRFVDVDLLLDLDLTYIADRLVALALPCVDSAMYRNDIRQVARFFSGRHYGGFVVTNLCEAFEEKGNGNYDCSLLYNQVQKLPMRDHNAPALCTLVLFCESATEWLNQNKNNIIAVHCQGSLLVPLHRYSSVSSLIFVQFLPSQRREHMFRNVFQNEKI